jgi:hypothetical protein
MISRGSGESDLLVGHSGFGQAIVFTLGSVGSNLVYLLIMCVNVCCVCFICVLDTQMLDASGKSVS